MVDTVAQVSAPVTITIEHPGGKSVISVSGGGGGSSVTPSPDGTSVTTIGPAAVDSALRSFTLVAEDASKKGQQVAVNGKRDIRTGAATRLYAKGGVVYHTNTQNNWYSLDTADVWHDATNPTGAATVPPAAAGVPAPAAAVGYNKRTLGPRVILSGPGQNWFQDKNITTNSDGSVTLRGGNSGFNYDAVTGDGHSFGTAFGGGLYIEMDHSWTGSYSNAGGWPSYWSNAVESRSIAAAPNWPNAGDGAYDAVEWDILETFSDGWGQTIWDWSNGAIGNRYGAVAGAWNAVGGVHSGPTDGRRKKVGALWVPATATTKGRAEIYLDGKLLPAQTITWNRWTPSVGLPLRNGDTAGAIMDFQHLNFIMGTGPNNPMTVYSMEIWQKDGSGNLPPT